MVFVGRAYAAPVVEAERGHVLSRVARGQPLFATVETPVPFGEQDERAGHHGGHDTQWPGHEGSPVGEEPPEIDPSENDQYARYE